MERGDLNTSIRLPASLADFYPTGSSDDRVSTAQLDGEGDGDAGELLDVFERVAGLVDGVLARVDRLRRIGEGALNHEGRGRPNLGPRGVCANAEVSVWRFASSPRLRQLATALPEQHLGAVGK